MHNLDFPLLFTFKISSFANDFTAVDASGHTIAYVRQKMMKLKEDINIYDNESKTNLIYNIKADKWIDFSAAYTFSNSTGLAIGKVGRKGWASLWKAAYEIFDRHDQLKYQIREENGWVKVADSILGEIPVISMLSGYLFNPSYKVTDSMDRMVFRLTKEPSFWGRRFKVEKLTNDKGVDDDIVVLGLMMMILLERRRG